MPDIINENSGYQTGSIDTATVLVSNVSPISAKHPNGIASAVVQIESILGSGTSLKGTQADLVSRLALGLDSAGRLRINQDASTIGPLSIARGGMGDLRQSTGKRFIADGTTIQAIDFVRSQVFIASGTFTVPANTTSFFVEVYGAGGGGGGGGGGCYDGGIPAGSNGGSGARGRPGGYASAVFTGQTPGAIYAVTVGAGGTAGGAGALNTSGGSASAGGAGGTGGSSSFGAAIGCSGGAGGGAGGGGTTNGSTTANGASANSELTADGAGSGPAGAVVLDGRGAMGGKGGAGGVGDPVSTTNGTAGAVGSTGKVVIWY